MKKIFLFIIYLLIIFILFISKISLAFIILSILFPIFVLLYNSLVTKEIKKESKKYLTYSNYINDIRRNFDYIILGSDKIYNYYRNKKNEDYHLNYSFFNRNIYINEKIIKNFYSLVKNNGKILLYVDVLKDFKNESYFSSLDILILNRLFTNKIENKKKRYKMLYPCFADFILSLKVFLKIIFNLRILELNFNFKKRNLNFFVEKIIEVMSFCEYRDINLEIILIEYNNDSQKINDIIKTKLKNKYDLKILKM